MMPSPKKILIVEDEPDIREMLSIMLAGLECDISLAADGFAALDLLREDRFHAALIDLKMPRMSGEELIEKIRRTDDRISIVVLSGHGNRDKFADLREKFHISDFLSKPLRNRAQLLSAVRNALETEALRDRTLEADGTTARKASGETI